MDGESFSWSHSGIRPSALQLRPLPDDLLQGSVFCFCFCFCFCRRRGGSGSELRLSKLRPLCPDLNTKNFRPEKRLSDAKDAGKRSHCAQATFSNLYLITFGFYFFSFFYVYILFYFIFLLLGYTIIFLLYFKFYVFNVQQFNWF